MNNRNNLNNIAIQRTFIKEHRDLIKNKKLIYVKFVMFLIKISLLLKILFDKWFHPSCIFCANFFLIHTSKIYNSVEI